MSVKKTPGQQKEVKPLLSAERRGLKLLRLDDLQHTVAARMTRLHGVSTAAPHKTDQHTRQFPHSSSELGCPAFNQLVSQWEFNSSSRNYKLQLGHPPRRWYGVVVLPLSYRPFTFCTMGQYFSGKVKHGPTTPDNTRYDDHPESTSQTPVETTGRRPATTVNLVLLGMAGTGKSASGNTILGHQQFMSRASSGPVTTECQEAETVVGGRHVRVIDTPDMFDDDIQASVKAEHVRRCRELCQQEPRVYLLVMHVSRFTDGEKNLLTKLENAFGGRVHEQTVIVFTREDDLTHGETSFQEFLQSCNPDLKKIVEKCGYRCVAFENKASRQHQVERLMQTVDDVLN